MRYFHLFDYFFPFPRPWDVGLRDEKREEETDNSKVLNLSLSIESYSSLNRPLWGVYIFSNTELFKFEEFLEFCKNVLNETVEVQIIIYQLSDFSVSSTHLNRNRNRNWNRNCIGFEEFEECSMFWYQTQHKVYFKT